MALSGAVLYNSTGSWLNLNDYTNGYGIDWSAAIGRSEIRRTITKPWQRGYDPLSAVSWGNRVIKLPLHFGGTSQDNWSLNYQAVRNVLAEAERWYTSQGSDGSQAWLAVQLNGQTNPVVFDVIGGEVDLDSAPQHYFGPTMVSTTSPRLPVTPVTLFCRPFAHPQATQSLSSTTLTVGNSQTGKTPFYLQPAILGNWEPPARININPNAQYGYLLMARRSQGNVGNFIWPYLFNTNAHTGYTTTATSGYAIPKGASTSSYPWYLAATATVTFTNVGSITASNNGTVSNWSVPNATALGTWAIAYYTFTVTGNLIDQIGNHRMIVSIKAPVTAGTQSLTNIGGQLMYGGSGLYAGVGTGNAIVTTPIGGSAGVTGPVMLDLGVLPISYPQTGTPGSFVFTICLWGQLVANAAFTPTNVLAIDCVFPMPLDEQQFQFRGDYNSATSRYGPFAASSQFLKDDISLLPSYTNLNGTTGDQNPDIIVPDYDSGRFLMPLAVQKWFPLWWNPQVNTAGNTNTGGLDYTSTATLNVQYTPMFEVTN
jgi:hypothetical protein